MPTKVRLMRPADLGSGFQMIATSQVWSLPAIRRDLLSSGLKDRGVDTGQASTNRRRR